MVIPDQHRPFLAAALAAPRHDALRVVWVQLAPCLATAEDVGACVEGMVQYPEDRAVGNLHPHHGARAKARLSHRKRQRLLPPPHEHLACRAQLVELLEHSELWSTSGTPLNAQPAAHTASSSL
jgi:hypothetical protein